MKVIMVMGLFVVVFWAGFEQAGGLMNVYSQQYTDRMISGFEVPAAWFQSLNPLFIITLAPILAALWIKMGKNEPNSPIKFALAFFFHTLGELCLSPIGLSMVTKLAPLRLVSLMMGVWFGFDAIANYVAGYIGSHVGDFGALAIFGGIAVTATLSGLLLILCSNQLII
jgi:POT family proton-dependent oligopeptide transporter